MGDYRFEFPAPIRTKRAFVQTILAKVQPFGVPPSGDSGGPAVKFVLFICRKSHTDRGAERQRRSVVQPRVAPGATLGACRRNTESQRASDRCFLLRLRTGGQGLFRVRSSRFPRV